MGNKFDSKNPSTQLQAINSALGNELLTTDIRKSAGNSIPSRISLRVD